MELYIAGGCGEHGRNSFLLSDKGELLLVDCGKGSGDFLFPKLKKEQIRKLRYLFLTHSHKDHSGGIEWLIENGFHGCIISTDETRKQVNIAYENWVILPVTGRMPLRKEIGQTLSITYGRTGHCIGSIWFLIEWNYKKVFFSGDYKEDSSVYMCDRVRNVSADCAVIDCAYGNVEIDPSGFEGSFIKYVENTIRVGGAVYLPVPKYGRGLEIIQILNKSGDEYPVYADRNIYEQIEQRGCLWTESMNISLQSLETWNDEPAVLFISDPQLQKEEDYELAIKVYQNSGSILLTGHVYPGTGAEKLLKKKYATSMLYPVHMNYHDLCEFVKANHFANVILNHHAGRINDMEHIALNVDTGKTIEF